jgi:ubiquinone/menaquinone biosynthesis C-methylase UbiE
MLRRWLVLLCLLCTVPVCAETTDVLQDAGVEGGLVVVLGCGNADLLCRFRANERYIVHGLDRDPADVARARRHIRSEGLYGPVSVMLWRGPALPYADNLVNLLVVVGDQPLSDSSEMMRVLAPGGRVVSLEGRSLTTNQRAKPWPAEIDEWTHYLHDASGNSVAQDTRVGPPRRMQ